MNQEWTKGLIYNTREAIFFNVGPLKEDMFLNTSIFHISVINTHIINYNLSLNSNMPERQIHIGIMYSYLYSNKSVTYFH